MMPGPCGMKRIAVIIPVHNGLEHTLVCLENLHQQMVCHKLTQMMKVVLVDDGSTDGTAPLVRERYPEVVVLHGDGNLWWTGAINMGAKYAMTELGADYVLLWNNDLVAADDYFENLPQICRDLDDNTMVGSKVYYMDRPGVILATGGIFDPRTGRKKLLGSRQPDTGRYDEVIQADWCGGMGTLVSRAIITRVGYWDDKAFPHYHADTDYCLRAQRMGVRLLIYPNLKIYNDKSCSGIVHNDSCRLLIRSLYSLKSNHNMYRNFKFYRRHCTFSVACRALLRKYAGYIGGFVKWKVLGLMGIHRPLSHLPANSSSPGRLSNVVPGGDCVR